VKPSVPCSGAQQKMADIASMVLHFLCSLTTDCNVKIGELVLI
jgi:hypothetical protein